MFNEMAHKMAESRKGPAKAHLLLPAEAMLRLFCSFVAVADVLRMIIVLASSHVRSDDFPKCFPLLRNWTPPPFGFLRHGKLRD